MKKLIFLTILSLIFLFGIPGFVGADCVDSSHARGFVFDDRNNDGYKDIDEPGINGVQIVIWRGRNGAPDAPAGITVTTGTDANGNDGYYDSGEQCLDSMFPVITLPTGWFKSTTTTDSTPKADFWLDFGITKGFPKPFDISGFVNTNCLLDKTPVIDINWTSSDNIDPIANPLTDRYEVYRIDAPENPIATVLSGATTYRDTSVISGNPYSYFIKGYNSSGSETSDTYTTFAPDCTTRLIIKNVNPDPSFSSTFRGSGKQISDTGSNWYNPMDIQVKTNKTNIADIYVAFYNKTSPSPYSMPLTFLNTIESKLSTASGGDNSFGFLLAYGEGARINPPDSGIGWYVWDGNLNLGNGGWIKLSLSLLTVCPGNQPGCTQDRGLYDFLSAGAAAWRASFGINLSSKNFYTAVLIKDQTGEMDLEPDIVPQ